MKNILWKRPDGALGFTFFSSEESGKAIAPEDHAKELLLKTEIESGLQKGTVAVGYNVDLPDYFFLKAWVFDDKSKTVKIDLSKAIEVIIDLVRERRNTAFDSLDKAYMIAQRDGVDLAPLNRERQILKDLTSELRSKAAKAKIPEEIKACWPTEILGAM
jgi:hypothetical protein